MRPRFTPEEHRGQRGWIDDLPPPLRVLYDGPTQNIGRPPIPLIERICSGIEVVESGCWEWQRSRDKDGYGKMTIGGGPQRHQRVHNVVWLLLVGSILDGLMLDHLCRNTRCCNPEHLEPVPEIVNLMRGNGAMAINARKTHCPHGHAYTDDNTRWVNTGHGRRGRKCRTCYP